MRKERWGVTWEERNGGSTVWKEGGRPSPIMVRRSRNSAAYRSDVRTWVNHEEDPVAWSESSHVEDGLVVFS